MKLFSSKVVKRVSKTTNTLQLFASQSELKFTWNEKCEMLNIIVMWIILVNFQRVIAWWNKTQMWLILIKFNGDGSVNNDNSRFDCIDFSFIKARSSEKLTFYSLDVIIYEWQIVQLPSLNVIRMIWYNVIYESIILIWNEFNYV